MWESSLILTDNRTTVAVNTIHGFAHGLHVLKFHVQPVGPVGTPSGTGPTSAVVIIPARYRSKRLPGKPLADICGHPMIEHVYRRAAAASSIRAVLVATDDERIRDAVVAFGGKVVMTASTHETGTDRLAEVARDLTCDLIVNVQGDEPLIEPQTIDLAVSAFKAETNMSHSIATLRCAITDPGELRNPNVVKVVVDRSGHALYFSRAPIPHLETSPSTMSNHADASIQTPILGYKHVGLYVYRRDVLLRLAALEPTRLERAECLEQLRALENGYRITTLETSHYPIGVDTPFELERVRSLMSDKNPS